MQAELPKKGGLGQLTHLREAKKGGGVSEGARYAREIAATEGCLKNHSRTIPFIYFLQSKPVCHLQVLGNCKGLKVRSQGILRMNRKVLSTPKKIRA